MALVGAPGLRPPPSAYVLARGPAHPDAEPASGPNDLDVVREAGDHREAQPLRQQSFRIVRAALCGRAATSEAASGNAVSGNAVSRKAVSGEGLADEAVTGKAATGEAVTRPRQTVSASRPRRAVLILVVPVGGVDDDHFEPPIRAGELDPDRLGGAVRPVRLDGA